MPERSQAEKPLRALRAGHTLRLTDFARITNLPAIWGLEQENAMNNANGRNRLILRRGAVALAVAAMLVATGCADARKHEQWVEGPITPVMEFAGFGAQGLQMINSNFLVCDGIAYCLFFSADDCELVGVDGSGAGEGIAIPVPAALGTVIIHPGARYRVRGEVFEQPPQDYALEGYILREQVRQEERNNQRKQPRSSIAVMMETEAIIRKGAQIPRTFEGHPVKMLRVTHLELKTPPVGDTR
jgi:hypothetical protein